MASFKIAESITGRNEGGYANNKADTGGETYAGIARNHWPKWEGWRLIDAIKEKVGTFPKSINTIAKQSPVIEDLISSFYKKNFWDVMKLDAITDQQLANSVYDFGVNSGTGRASKFLQEASNETGLVNLTVDGAIGNKTIAAVNSLNAQNVHANYNRRRKAFYESIAKGNQKQFLKSWLSRLKPYKPCV